MRRYSCMFIFMGDNFILCYTTITLLWIAWKFQYCIVLWCPCNMIPLLLDSMDFDCITVHLPNKFMQLVGISFESGMASGKAKPFCCIHFPDVSTDEKLSKLTAQRIQRIRDCCCEWAETTKEPERSIALQTQEVFFDESFYYHNRCYIRLTNTGKIEKARKRKQVSSSCHTWKSFIFVGAQLWVFLYLDWNLHSEL